MVTYHLGQILLVLSLLLSPTMPPTVPRRSATSSSRCRRADAVGFEITRSAGRRRPLAAGAPPRPGAALPPRPACLAPSRPRFSGRWSAWPAFGGYCACVLGPPGGLLGAVSVRARAASPPSARPASPSPACRCVGSLVLLVVVAARPRCPPAVRGVPPPRTCRRLPRFCCARCRRCLSVVGALQFSSCVSAPPAFVGVSRCVSLSPAGAAAALLVGPRSRSCGCACHRPRRAPPASSSSATVRRWRRPWATCAFRCTFGGRSAALHARGVPPGSPPRRRPGSPARPVSARPARYRALPRGSAHPRRVRGAQGPSRRVPPRTASPGLGSLTPGGAAVAPGRFR